MLYQTLSHTLKLAPHESPSSQPLTKNPQQLCYFLCKALTKDPQQVWQTLNNFDYPNRRCTIAHSSYETSPIMCFCLGIKGIFHPLLHPLVSAIVTWMFRRRQGKCYKIVTFANPTKQILCFRLKPLKELFHSTNRKRLCF